MAQARMSGDATISHAPQLCRYAHEVAETSPDALRLCRAILSTTRAVQEAVDGEESQVVALLEERAKLLAALAQAGFPSAAVREQCLALLREAQELDGITRRRLEQVRTHTLDELKALRGGRRALHAYRAAAAPAPGSLCLDQTG